MVMRMSPGREPTPRGVEVHVSETLRAVAAPTLSRRRNTGSQFIGAETVRGGAAALCAAAGDPPRATAKRSESPAPFFHPLKLRRDGRRPLRGTGARAISGRRALAGGGQLCLDLYLLEADACLLALSKDAAPDVTSQSVYHVGKVTDRDGVERALAQFSRAVATAYGANAGPCPDLADIDQIAAATFPWLADRNTQETKETPS